MTGKDIFLESESRQFIFFCKQQKFSKILPLVANGLPWEQQCLDYAGRGVHGGQHPRPRLLRHLVLARAVQPQRRHDRIFCWDSWGGPATCLHDVLRGLSSRCKLNNLDVVAAGAP